MSKPQTQQNGWREVKLGDVAKIITGKTPPTKQQELFGNDFPFITPTDINDSKRFCVTNRFLSKKGAEFQKSLLLPKNTICYTCIASIGKVCVTKKDSFTNQQINSLIADINTINHWFLFYTLKHITPYIQSIAGGTTAGIVNKTQFSNIEIFLPPLPEQKAIAEVLSSLDDKIDQLHRQNKTLEDMAQALFRKWFVEEAKEDWEEKPLDEIAEYLNGLACQKYPPENEIDRLPVLKIKELNNGISDNSDWATSNIDEKYIVELGDVIFSWSGSLMLKIWNGQKCVLNQHLFKVTSEKYPKWFYYFWTKHHLEKFIGIADSKATTMGHIKRGDLSNSLVRIPKTEELSKMDEKMSPIFEKIVLNYNQIANLEQQRDVLLPKLMSAAARMKFN